MARKVSEDVVRSLLAEKDWEPVEGWEYVDVHTPIPGRCRICGYEGTGPRYANLKRCVSACKECGIRAAAEKLKAPEDEVRALLSEKNWEPVEGWKYVYSSTPIPGRCLVEECGYSGPGPTYSNLKTWGACPRCAGREKNSEETVLALLKEKNWEPAEGWEYLNGKTPIPGQCLVCGYEGPGPRYTDLQKGRGACIRCSGKEKNSNETVRALLAEKNWEPVEGWEYVDNRTPIPGQCLVCGYEGPGPRYSDLNNGQGACGSCKEGGYDPAKPGYFYTFVFTDDSGDDFICYGITNDLGRRRYEYERYLAIRGFQSLRFEDGAKAARAEKLFHDVRKASNAPYPNSQVVGTRSEAFPLSDFELCMAFTHHWIAADSISGNKYSLHAPNGELVKQRP